MVSLIYLFESYVKSNVIIYLTRITGKGDMDYILVVVPFSNCEEEPRYHTIIAKLIEAGEVPEYKAFTEESEKKKLRRKRKVCKKT